MTKVIRIAVALSVVVLALVGLSACGGSSGVPGNAVVDVNGTPITKEALKHWVAVAAISGASGEIAKKPVAPEPPNYTACIAHLKEVAAASKVKTPLTAAKLKTQCEQQYKTLTQEALGFLIANASWVPGEAAALGIKLSDAEVHKQFVKIRTTQFPSAAEFQKFLSSSGQTISDLLLRVKINLLSTKIQQKIIKEKSKVTQAQVQKYYNEHQSTYETPEKRNLLIILTKTEAAAKSAKKEVESGKSFESVAKRVSIDPTSKSKGGLLTEVSKGQEEQALNAAVFSAKPNVLSGPVKTAFGYYIFKVLSSKAGSKQSLAQVQASIKQQLVSTQEQTAFSKFVKEFKTRWTAKTNCNAGYVVQYCKQYKAPKTSSTGTTSAG